MVPVTHHAMLLELSKILNDTYQQITQDLIQSSVSLQLILLSHLLTLTAQVYAIKY